MPLYNKKGNFLPETVFLRFRANPDSVELNDLKNLFLEIDRVTEFGQ